MGQQSVGDFGVAIVQAVHVGVDLFKATTDDSFRCVPCKSETRRQAPELVAGVVRGFTALLSGDAHQASVAVVAGKSVYFRPLRGNSSINDLSSKVLAEESAQESGGSLNTAKHRTLISRC